MLGTYAVGKPDLSTVFLNNPQKQPIGYPDADMELSELLKIVERLLKEQNLSAHEASIRAGHPYVIQNMRRTVKQGRTRPRPKQETLADLFRVLGEPPPGVLVPEPPRPANSLSDADWCDAQAAELEAKAKEYRNAAAIIRQRRKSG